MRKRRVVLVENDAWVREALVSALDRRFDVSVSGTFSEGETLLGVEHDILLTDYDLEEGPTRTGADLAWVFQERHPRGRCILMSGGRPPEETLRRLKSQGGVFLEKPFSNQTLIEVLDSVCSQLQDNDGE
jgi:DNA-binding NtrC family response regulator